MRLINIDTLKLEDFPDDRLAPPYAILSHTWGSEEVTLQDALAFSEAEDRLEEWQAWEEAGGSQREPFDRASRREYQRTHNWISSLKGWKKIAEFCSVVRETSLVPAALRHAWIDTCCIDKTSSADLSEAINSMFRWYRGTVACFVILEDVDRNCTGNDDSSVIGLVSEGDRWCDDGSSPIGPDFEEARWFTRGWTLQELLAPKHQYFFDKHWTYIGAKTDLASRIQRRTNILEDVIVTGSFARTSIAQRMSWASHRETTRPEDIAYCLLGIFDINMPLLYGEGSRAFKRLQEEILRESDDQSILAWDASGKDESIRTIGALADHPLQFQDCSNVECVEAESRVRLVHGEIEIMAFMSASSDAEDLAVLACRDASEMSSRLAIPIEKISTSGPLNPEKHMPRFGRLRQPSLRIELEGSRTERLSGLTLFKRDVAAQLSSIKRCWLHWDTEFDIFWPSITFPPAQWMRSRAREMTMLIPTRSHDADEISMAAVTSSWVKDGRNKIQVSVCVVIKIEPYARRGSASFHLFQKSGGHRPTLEEHLINTMYEVKNAEAATFSQMLDLRMLDTNSLASKLKHKNPVKVRVQVLDDSFSTLEVAIEKPSDFEIAAFEEEAQSSQ